MRGAHFNSALSAWPSPDNELEKLKENMKADHGFFMDQALSLAKRAGEEGEVPVGAVAVFKGEIIAEAFNTREREQNPMGHAEITALKRACEKLGTWRLSECSLYVTLEPCLMCTGALLQARITHLIYGCPDPKGGCVTSLYRLPEDLRFNHKMKVTGGIREKQCSKLLKTFFKNLRNKTNYTHFV